MSHLFTSEAVGAGHPDVVADVIADTVVETYILNDPWARTSIEVLIKGSEVVIAGEVTTFNSPASTQEELEAAVIKAVKKIGYNGQKFSDTETLNADNLSFTWNLTKQSSEISMGMDKEDIGANDQGIMLGYAEHSSVYPEAEGRALTVALAQDLARRLHSLAMDPSSPFGVDIKTQVTLDFHSLYNFQVSGARSAPTVDSVVVAIPTISSCPREVFEPIVRKIIHDLLNSVDDMVYDEKAVKIFINSTGKYTNHGPLYDCFPKGTMIATPEGRKPIETLDIGNKVLGYDLESKEGVETFITDTKSTEGRELVMVTFEDGSTQICSSNEMFLTENGYVEISNLIEGSEVISI